MAGIDKYYSNSIICWHIIELWGFSKSIFKTIKLNAFVITNCFNFLFSEIESRNWGIGVLNAGCTTIGTAREYPLERHPNKYHFQWMSGRVLDEY